MYLPAQAQDTLFTQISELSTAGSRIAAETAAVQSDDRRAETRTRFEKLAEQIGFAHIDIAELMYRDDNRAALTEWLNHHGWRALAQHSEDEMRRLGRWVQSIPPGDDKDAYSDFVTAQRL